MLLLSTALGCDLGTAVKRLACVKDAKEFKRVLMQAPLLAVFYNMFMGETDAFDRLKLARSTSLELSIVVHSWSKKLTFGMIDQAVTNSFIIYRHHHPKVTHREFVVMLHA